jgi:hypothetical protein
MLTVVTAILLLVVGLSIEGSILSIPGLNDLIADLSRQFDVRITEQLARAAIVGSPVILILGSLLRGL